MNHVFGKNILLVSILAMGLALGGCALHPQRGAATQNGDRINKPPEKQESVTSEASPPIPAPQDTEIGLAHEASASSAASRPQIPATNDLDESLSKLWTSTENDSAPDNEDGGTDEFASNEPADNDSLDLWDRIRRGFDLTDQQNARINREAEWFGRHQAYLDRVAERAQPYLHYIVNQVQQRGMPSEIALLPVVESAFQPYAYSAGRAAGIWQFIPGTGRRYGLQLNWWYDGRRDIVASTQAALDYLQYLHDTFDGDWLLALAAYNSGEGTVVKAIHANQRRHKPTDFWSLRLPRETEQYVPRLLALRKIVANPEQQGISLLPIADEAYLTAVKIDSQLDLATAAKLANMDLEELHQLNPGFNRWATAPDGPHRLLLPLDKAAAFATSVAELSPEDQVHWVRHRVRRGETLSHLASHYKTTSAVLSQLNKLKGHSIHPGQYLIIPIESSNTADDAAESSKQIAAQETVNAVDKTLHTVNAGDTLWDMARHYGTSIRQLRTWNKLKSGDDLRPGQQLVVGFAPTPIETSANLHMLTMPAEIAKPRKITYTVRRGDSLARISQRFRVTIQQVISWNAIKKNKRLRPGQALTLYVPLTGDSERG